MTLRVVRLQRSLCSSSCFLSQSNFRFAELILCSKSVAWPFLSLVFKSLFEEEKRPDESRALTLLEGLFIAMFSWSSPLTLALSSPIHSPESVF